ncbi:MAG: hypothetical protein R2825_06670 [Saprospiraceae bacterium]
MVIDTKSKVILQNVPTGRYPFGLCFSEKENALYVANVGMFEYSYLNQLDSADLKGTAADFPTSGFNTQEMREGYKKTDWTCPVSATPMCRSRFLFGKSASKANPMFPKKSKRASSSAS